MLWILAWSLVLRKCIIWYHIIHTHSIFNVINMVSTMLPFIYHHIVILLTIQFSGTTKKYHWLSHYPLIYLGYILFLMLLIWSLKCYHIYFILYWYCLRYIHVVLQKSITLSTHLYRQHSIFNVIKMISTILPFIFILW